MLVDDKRMQNNEQRLAWYRNAKFGLFIHWGAWLLSYLKPCLELKPGSRKKNI
jgi:hypothetical protein